MSDEEVTFATTDGDRGSSPLADDEATPTNWSTTASTASNTLVKAAGATPVAAEIASAVEWTPTTGDWTSSGGDMNGFVGDRTRSNEADDGTSPDSTSSPRDFSVSLNRLSTQCVVLDLTVCDSLRFRSIIFDLPRDFGVSSTSASGRSVLPGVGVSCKCASVDWERKSCGCGCGCGGVAVCTEMEGGIGGNAVCSAVGNEGERRGEGAASVTLLRS